LERQIRSRLYRQFTSGIPHHRLGVGFEFSFFAIVNWYVVHIGHIRKLLAVALSFWPLSDLREWLGHVTQDVAEWFLRRTLPGVAKTHSPRLSQSNSESNTENLNSSLTRARRALAERKRDEPVASYYLYQLFLEGGCNAVKQWGLFDQKYLAPFSNSSADTILRLSCKSARSVAHTNNYGGACVF